MLRDQPRDSGAIDVAHDDHGHQVRAIPIAVEPGQRLTLGPLDDLRGADRGPVRIARSFELHAADSVRCALVSAQVHPPLGENDGPLALDAGLVERGTSRPVLEHRQRAVEDVWHIGRHAQRVLRLVEACRRICVRAEAESERAEKIVDALSGEVSGALELHVLDKVRQAPLVVVFQDRAGFDDQPQLRLPCRFRIRPHVEAQTVGQRADENFGVDWHLRRQRVGGDRRCGRLAPGLQRLRRRSRNSGGGKQEREHTARGVPETEQVHVFILSDAKELVEWTKNQTAADRGKRRGDPSTPKL